MEGTRRGCQILMWEIGKSLGDSKEFVWASCEYIWYHEDYKKTRSW
jgi:hypothetical protein